MSPLSFDFRAEGETWSALVFPETGRCDLWCGRAYAGSVVFSIADGWGGCSDRLRGVLPALGIQLKLYEPLLQQLAGVPARAASAAAAS